MKLRFTCFLGVKNIIYELIFEKISIPAMSTMVLSSTWLFCNLDCFTRGKKKKIYIRPDKILG